MPAIKQLLPNITREDIERIVRDAWPEDEELEFKQEIPARDKNRQDRWYTAQEGLDDYGRNQLLAEVVALANTYGGDVVIGIVESTDKPARAAGIKTVPRPAELAHRLEMAARDCIDPPIPLLQARGIPLSTDDTGVVVIRVPRSRNAPHRLRPPLQCYKRVRDRTEQMSMREIQDLTFSVARGIADVDRKLRDLQQRFHTECNLDQVPANTARLALNVRAIPASADLFVERVHNVDAIAPHAKTFTLTFDNRNQHSIQPLYRPSAYRPVLRGTRAANGRDGFAFSLLLLCNGSLSFIHRFDNPNPAPPTDSDRSHRLYPSWLISLVLNTADTADRFRAFAGASTVEYALELEVVSQPEGVPVVALGAQTFRDELGRLPAGATVFPRYSLWGPDTRAAWLQLFWRDFWNAAGVDAGTTMVTDIQ